jgi:predicted CxxxxCH...CXXCH cytochrome family protein
MRLSLSILPLLVACGGATKDTAETDAPVDTAASDTSSETDTATDTDPQDTATTPAWADVDTILGSNCASCHYGEPAGLGFVDAYDRLVNTPSTQAPDLDRVTPGDLDGSYLWRKLEGTHVAAGGSGTQMPQRASLSANDTDTIRRWILGGAPR